MISGPCCEFGRAGVMTGTGTGMRGRPLVLSTLAGKVSLAAMMASLSASLTSLPTLTPTPGTLMVVRAEGLGDGWDEG